MTDDLEPRGDMPAHDAVSAPASGTPSLSDDSSSTAAASPEATAPAAAEPKESAFAKLGLAPELLAAIADLGFTEPTAVQLQTIPRALRPSGGSPFTDLMVSSQTGSGKTAAFLLPVLDSLIERRATQAAAERAEFERLAAEAAAKGEPPLRKPRRHNPNDRRSFSAAVPGALVLCPTRELAQQVAHDAIDLVKHARGLRVANVVGGMPYQLQIQRLQNAELVVATPGRLLDLQRSGALKLDQVRFLVVDEADRMLDLGFADDLAEINRLTAQRQQTMMFSATFAPRIQALAERVMREPQRLAIAAPHAQHANIRQSLYWADHPEHKRALLDHWLRDASIEQAIVFASTQIECDALAQDLQEAGFSAVALHGALSQGLRNRRLGALRNGQVQILVATDVAARGIDVPSISHVFNFGLPMKAEDYTHRIGRTGRAGRDGLAITFAEPRDRRRIADIEHFTRHPFVPAVIAGLEPRMRMEAPRRDAGARRRPGEGGPRGFGRPSGGRDFDRPRAGGFDRGGERAPDRGFDRDGSRFDARRPAAHDRRPAEPGVGSGWRGARPDAGPRHAPAHREDPRGHGHARRPEAHAAPRGGDRFERGPRDDSRAGRPFVPRSPR